VARSGAARLIEDYGRGLVPLVVPLTLIRHYVTRFDVAYLRGQHYLEPHPRDDAAGGTFLPFCFPGDCARLLRFPALQQRRAGVPKAEKQELPPLIS
jgi:hypothetical protein